VVHGMTSLSLIVFVALFSLDSGATSDVFSYSRTCNGFLCKVLEIFDAISALPLTLSRYIMDIYGYVHFCSSYVIFVLSIYLYKVISRGG